MSPNKAMQDSLQSLQRITTQDQRKAIAEALHILCESEEKVESEMATRALFEDSQRSLACVQCGRVQILKELIRLFYQGE